jgi:hypothetical protein
MANVTVTSNAEFIPTLVADKALGKVVGNLFLTMAASRNWQAELASFGNTVNVPIRGSVSANDKSADSDVTLQSPTATKAAVVLNKHKEASFFFEDVAVTESNQDTLAGYAQDAAVAIAEQIETDGFTAAYTGFTTNTAIGTAAVDATDDLVLSARKVMKDAKVPVSAPIWLFLSTKDMKALLSLDKYTNADKLGDGGVAIAEGPMTRKIYGMNLVESQYPVLVSTTTHDICFSPEALTLAMRPIAQPSNGLGAVSSTVGGIPGTQTSGLGLRVTMGYRIAGLGTQLTVDALYGWKVCRNAFGLDVQT